MSSFLTVIAAIAACSDMSGTLVAAHRGGLDGPYPENTLPAFRQAVDIGAQLIEMDLRATADSVVVIHHDRSLARTAGSPALVHRLTLEEIRALDPAAPAAIPTLQEVLAWAAPQPVTLLLDVKPAPGLQPDAVLQPVLAAGLSRRVLFGVRNLADLAAFRDHGEHLRFLGFVPNTDAIDAFLQAGVEGIRLWPRWLQSQPDLVTQLQRAGVAVWVTVGNAEAGELRRLSALGVQGVITDRPAMAMRAIGCTTGNEAGADA